MNVMTLKPPSAGMVALLSHLCLFATVAAPPGAAQAVEDWPVHSMERPVPPIVVPAPAQGPVPPPSDAVVLFDGNDLSKWRSSAGGHAGWTVEDGYFEILPQGDEIMEPQPAGDIVTVDSFGDMQLHVEFSIPPGEKRGNSGVFFGGRRYEVQILDSYRNRTRSAPDAQAAAIYGQYPPLVNASRPAGEWQTYDILFFGPRFDGGGKVTRPAQITVFHNGILVQHNAKLVGMTRHKARPPYEVHPEEMPITLQNHGEPVRFRNIWVRELQGARP